MENPYLPCFEMIYVIVNYGIGSKVLRKAKEHGVRGGTVVLGKGTIKNALCNFLSLYDESKEIVLLGADWKTAEYALDELNRDFKFDKPNHGIAFSTGITDIIGSKCEKIDKAERGAEPMYKLITTIVNRGKAEDVIDAANEVGAKGGTIINARGSGIHETKKLFNMEIEPEKEMVLIIASTESAERIVNTIREKLELDKPGNGIAFIQDVNRAYGIYE